MNAHLEMTLEDYFAAHALQALIIAGGLPEDDDDVNNITDWAYEFASYMMGSREDPDVSHEDGERVAKVPRAATIAIPSPCPECKAPVTLEGVNSPGWVVKCMLCDYTTAAKGSHEEAWEAHAVNWRQRNERTYQEDAG